MNALNAAVTKKIVVQITQDLIDECLRRGMMSREDAAQLEADFLAKFKVQNKKSAVDGDPCIRELKSAAADGRTKCGNSATVGPYCQTCVSRFDYVRQHLAELGIDVPDKPKRGGSKAASRTASTSTSRTRPTPFTRPSKDELDEHDLYKLSNDKRPFCIVKNTPWVVIRNSGTSYNFVGVITGRPGSFSVARVSPGNRRDKSLDVDRAAEEFSRHNILPVAGPLESPIIENLIRILETINDEQFNEMQTFFSPEVRVRFKSDVVNNGSSHGEDNGYQRPSSDYAPRNDGVYSRPEAQFGEYRRPNTDYVPNNTGYRQDTGYRQEPQPSEYRRPTTDYASHGGSGYRQEPQSNEYRRPNTDYVPNNNMGYRQEPQYQQYNPTNAPHGDNRYAPPASGYVHDAAPQIREQVTGYAPQYGVNNHQEVPVQQYNDTGYRPEYNHQRVDNQQDMSNRQYNDGGYRPEQRDVATNPPADVQHSQQYNDGGYRPEQRDVATNPPAGAPTYPTNVTTQDEADNTPPNSILELVDWENPAEEDSAISDFQSKQDQINAALE